MFNFFKTKLSPKEEYEKTLNEMRIQAINNGEYNIGATDYERSGDWFYYIYVNFRNTLLGRGAIVKHNDDDRSKGWKKVFLYKHYRERQEEERMAREKEKALQDERYMEKIQALLKTKPLDEDLKKAFKKAERIIEIGKEMDGLRKELLKLRK